MSYRYLLFLCLFTCSFVRAQHAWTEREIVLPGDPGSLFGTLTLPKSPKECPLVIFVAGSGPTDRNGNSILGLRTDSYRMMAEELAQNGIASFRYDKRGIAKSKNAMQREDELRFDQNVKDLTGWLETLTAEGKYTKVVYAGHSEGSLVCLMAAQKFQVDGVISLAGLGRPASLAIREQLKGKLSPKEELEADLIIDSLEMGIPAKVTEPKLWSLFRPSILPYLISWFKIDPAQEIAQLDIPVLIVQGGLDVQVKVLDAELLAKAKPDARLLLIDNLDHVLKQASPKDRPSVVENYIDPKRPLHPKLLPAMVDFVNSLQ